MAPWRLLMHGAASPARNMAIDEALLREIQGPVLRLYEWSIPAVSLGYFQHAALVRAGRSFVRRYTGGGLVDHAHDITYTIVLPRAHEWMQLSAPQSYQRIHQGVLAVLAACGVGATLAQGPSGLESEACFQKPVCFDIMAGNQKLSGAAQRRTREGLLHQGSILLPDPLLNFEVHREFAKSFFGQLQLAFQPGELAPSESDRAAVLERDRYSTAGWNEMR